MWGCDYTPMPGAWRGDVFPWGLLSLLIWGVVIVLIAYLVILLFKSQKHGLQGASQDRIDSLAILKARFASGEISQEEFIKMKRLILEP